MAPAALPAASATSRPDGAGAGRSDDRQFDGWAAATAVLNRLSRNARRAVVTGRSLSPSRSPAAIVRTFILNYPARQRPADSRAHHRQQQAAAGMDEVAVPVAMAGGATIFSVIRGGRHGPRREDTH